MPRDNKEDILLDYAFISLIPSKTRVIIIGGGRSGYIKAKSFFQKGYSVYVLSKKFDKNFKNLETSISMMRDEYKVDYILDKHLVVIATDDKDMNRLIKSDCEDNYKVYLDTSDPQNGQFVSPSEIRSDNINLAVRTSAGSPRTSLYLGEKIKENIKEYDDFVKYIGSLRRYILKDIKDRELNLQVMNFVNTDDFYFFYKKNKERLILKLFWRDEFDF